MTDLFDPALREDLAKGAGSGAALQPVNPEKPARGTLDMVAFKRLLASPVKRRKSPGPVDMENARLQSAGSAKPEMDPNDPLLGQDRNKPPKHRDSLCKVPRSGAKLQSVGHEKPEVDPYDPLKEVLIRPGKDKDTKSKARTERTWLQSVGPGRTEAEAQALEELKTFLTKQAKRINQPGEAAKSGERLHLAGQNKLEVDLVNPEELEKIKAKKTKRKASGIKKSKSHARLHSAGPEKPQVVPHDPLLKKVSSKKTDAAGIKKKMNLFHSPLLAVTGSVVNFSYGSSVSGSLELTDGSSRQNSASFADDYTFTGSAGDTVVIDLTSIDFDTFLYLYDEGGDLVVSNDDYGGTSRSLITCRLPSSGAYTIEITSYSENEVGEYQITLSAGLDRSVTEISYGSSVSGSLELTDGSSRQNSASFADDYTFTGSAGDTVVIDLASSAFDTYLYLYDQSGTLVAFNDDHEGTSRSLIIHTLSLSGTYTIEVTSYGDNETGEYRVDLSKYVNMFPDRSAIQISYGRVTTGSLSEIDGTSRSFIGHFADDYTFTGSAGDLVVIDLTSSSFDTYLNLYDQDGSLVAYNDDYGGTMHSLIEDRLPTSGTYTIEVTSYDNNATGDYLITLLGDEEINPERSVTEISYGDSVQGSLSTADGRSPLSSEHYADDYSFQGNTGETVVIKLNTTELDAYLILFDPNGDVVAYNDDFGSILRSFINYTLPSGGIYTIEVTSAYENETGDYLIALLGREGLAPERSVTEIPYNQPLDSSLGVADGTSRMGTGYFADDFTFTGSSGDSVAIDLTSDMFDTYLYLYDPEGSLVALNDDYGTTSRSYIWYRLASSGTHTIEVTSYGGLIGDYRITLLADDHAGPGRSFTEISYGSSIDGSLSETDGRGLYSTGTFVDDYTFLGGSGDSVVIDLESDEFEAFMFLLDPDGFPVTFSGKHESASSFIGYRLVSSGTYTIEVTSIIENATGSYRIRLLSADELAESQRAVTGISYGDSVAGSLNRLDGTSRLKIGSSADDFVFSASSGDTVAVQLKSGDFDTYLFLFDPDGDLLAENDDYEGISCSYIRYTLPSDGAYTIEVTSYGNNETGEYGIRLVSGVDAGPARSVVEIPFGTTLRGSLSAG
ncbi:DVUA0089 family protein, partial [Gemmatimonadota bacterium]